MAAWARSLLSSQMLFFCFKVKVQTADVSLSAPRKPLIQRDSLKQGANYLEGSGVRCAGEMLAVLS